MRLTGSPRQGILLFPSAPAPPAPRNSIQFAATQIMRAVLEDKIDNERLRLMLYALQVATWNLKACDLPGVNPEISNPDIRESRVTRPPSAGSACVEAGDLARNRCASIPWARTNETTND